MSKKRKVCSWRKTIIFEKLLENLQKQTMLLSFFMYCRYASFYFNAGITKGDEVIVPAQTHVATAHAVELVGAKPIFVDCDITTGNIDINKIEKK